MIGAVFLGDKAVYSSWTVRLLRSSWAGWGGVASVGVGMRVGLDVGGGVGSWLGSHSLQSGCPDWAIRTTRAILCAECQRLLILLIAGLGSIEARALRQALDATFAGRGTHAL